MSARTRKKLRWNKRIAAKIPENVYSAAVRRADKDHRTLSTVIVESLQERLSTPVPEVPLRSDRRHNPVYVRVVSAMVSPELHTAVEERAAQEQGKVSALVAAALSEYLKVKLPPPRR